MIQRVFNYAEVPCTGLLEHPEAGVARLKVEKISRTKAILLTTLSFPRYKNISLTLELSPESSLELVATVLEARDGRLFVRWEHRRYVSLGDGADVRQIIVVLRDGDLSSKVLEGSDLAEVVVTSKPAVGTATDLLEQ